MEVKYAQPTSPSVSIILPAYNEAEAIESAIHDVRTALTTHSSDFEIIVVDDGSTDQTANIASQLATMYPEVKVVKHVSNRGYGAAIRSGMKTASKQLVGFTDSDIQFNLQELDRFLLLARSYDLVCGYRIDRKDTWFRCFLSRVYNWIARLVLGIGVRDIDCAFKLFRSDCLTADELGEDGFLINSELLLRAKQKNLRTVEVGVSHRHRELGNSTISMGHTVPVLAGMARLWWNQVAISNATHLSAKPMPRLDRPSMVAGLVIAMIAGFMLYSNLGYPLIDNDETRYAEISREMVATGDWVMPQLNFKPYYDKPPLFYWATAVSYKLFGVSENSARLIPASCCFLMVVGTFWFCRRHFGLSTAVISSIVMLTSTGIIFCGRFLFIDPLLSMLVMLTTYFAYEAINADRLRMRWWVAAAVCCGLGVLAKGPVAGVLVVPPLFLFAWLSNSHATLQTKHWVGFGSVVALVALPWFIIAGICDPDFLYEFFYNHNLRRFAGAYHDQPFWFFVPVGLVFCHPWSCLLLPVSIFLFARREQFRNLRTPELGYLLLMAAWCFAFFSISKCKLPAYILPAAPLISIIVGYFLKLVLVDGQKFIANQFASWFLPWTATIVTSSIAIGMGVFLTRQGWIPSSQTGWLIVPWILVLLAVLLSVRWMKRPKIAWSVCGVLALVFVLQGTQQWVPSMSRAMTLFSGHQWADSEFQIVGRPIATFNDEWSGVPFYLNARIPNFSDDEIVELGEFLKDHPDGLVVLRKGYDKAKLEDELCLGSSLVEVGSRGEAIVLQIQSERIASQPDALQQGKLR